MEKEFYIASGLTNRIGEGQYYLTLDYDAVASAAVAEDVRALQAAFSLSDAWVYRTGSGFHVHFFNDNGLDAATVGKILKASSSVDPKFVESWEHFSAKGEGVTLRVSGKYRRRDVFFHDRAHGVREPSLLELSIAKSLETAMNESLESPIVGFGQYPVKRADVADVRDGSAEMPEGAAVDKLVGDGLLPEGASAEDAAELFSPKKTAAEDAVENGDGPDFPAWAIDKGVAALKKKWYSGPLREAVARVISASCEGRELALSVPHEYRTKDKPAAFFEKRTFFLSNVPSKEQMLAPYGFIVEKGGIVDFPYNFFESHSVLDVAKFGGKVSLFGDDRKRLREEFKKDYSKYLKGFDVVFDIDSKNLDKNESYVHARKLRDVLASMKLPFSLNFSGSKGFHLRIPADLVAEAAPELANFLRAGENDENAQAFFANLLAFAESHGVEADVGAYSGRSRSLIRVQWSVHQATGSVVKPLTDEEFDALEGKTLRQIRETYRADHVLAGNKALGTPKLNFRDKTLVFRKRLPDGRELSWEEMRDAGFPESEWLAFRKDVRDPASRELKKMADEDPKAFAAVIASGEYAGASVEAPCYVDLLTGKNYDYRRKGDMAALREFVLSLIPDAGRYASHGRKGHEETVYAPPF